MAMVRWEELPQRRRDEIDNGCVALSGMTKEMWDDFFGTAIARMWRWTMSPTGRKRCASAGRSG
jgi:hypothetical protein